MIKAVCQGRWWKLIALLFRNHCLNRSSFGHEKGAFTDASQAKPGLFEVATDGTIFLDEVAEMPLNTQAKLLKVLDTKRFRRVGGISDRHTEARFMTATNRDLVAMVKAGTFREDLYYLF